MSVSDVAFIVGPLAAVIVIPFSIIIIFIKNCSIGARILCALTAGAAGVAWVIFWRDWGTAFEFLDAYQAIPTDVSASQDRALWICAALVALTLITVATGILRLPHSASTEQAQLTER